MLTDWLKELFVEPRLSVDEQIEFWKRNPKLSPEAPGPVVMSAVSTAAPLITPRLLTTAEILKTYGNPGDPDNLTTITTPFTMRLAWDPSKPVTKITCHKKIAVPLGNVLSDILAHYGAARVKELGIDLFGGCLNYRPQRGLEKKYAAAIKAKNYELANTYLSRHSWATAFDLDPARNDLKTRAPKAQFSKPEYKLMVDICYQHGFIGYGRERNNDYMHFEIGVIL